MVIQVSVVVAIALAIAVAAGRLLSGWPRNGLIGGASGYTGATLFGTPIFYRLDALPSVVVALGVFWVVSLVLFWVASLVERRAR